MKLDIAVSEKDYIMRETQIIDNCFGFRSANAAEGMKVAIALRGAWYEGVLIRHWVGMAGITEIFNNDV